MEKREVLLFSSNFKYKYYVAKNLVSAYGWKYFMRRIFSWLFARRYLFYSESLQEIARVAPAQVPIRLDLLTEQDFSELISLRPYAYDHSLLQKRMRDGHFCFIGRSNNEMVHVRWMFKGSIYLPYLHRTLVLSPDEIYADDAYTAPGFRRKGIFEYAGYLLRLKLKELGYSRYSYVFASWQAMVGKLGKRITPNRVGELKIISWPSYKKYYWQGAVQELGNGKICIRQEDESSKL